MSKQKVFGPADERSLGQLVRCQAASGEDSVGVLCADHHLGYSMPIGGVIALKDAVMPAGVGYDIACGNCAAQTNIKADDLDTAKVMDEVADVLSFGVGRKNNEKVDHPRCWTPSRTRTSRSRRRWCSWRRTNLARSAAGTTTSISSALIFPNRMLHSAVRLG